MVNEFPLTAAIPAALLSIVVLFMETKAVRYEITQIGGFRAAALDASERAFIGGAARFFGYLIGLIIVAYLFGQMIALSLFICVYLLRWGEYSWKISVSYAAVGLLFLYGFYDRVMNVFWHMPLIYGF